MKKYFLILIAVLIFLAPGSKAQEYKLKQSTGMIGMKSESVVYVKGMRKRTEPGTMMGMPAQPITIEQCDLQRTIKINNNKKLYYIDSFYKQAEEIIEEDEMPAAKKTAVPAKEKTTLKKGGVITTWYNIRDTGERKKMYGFTARHVWTTRKMKPSEDACMMKDSFLVKTDGWYIDLPKFNCPFRYQQVQRKPGEMPKPDCRDRFVTRRSGKGKLGFPLVEATTMIMGGQSTSNEFKTELETLDFSMEKLDSMLFEIPIGYTETKNEEDLQEKMDIGNMMNDLMKTAKNKQKEKQVSEQKAPTMKRFAVLQPKTDDQVQSADLQNRLAGVLTGGATEAVVVSSVEEAKGLNCDYLLTSELTKIKSASKVGGLLKAIKNTDPNAMNSYSIEGSVVLIRVADDSELVRQKINGKFEGKINEAAGKALEEAAQKILSKLK
ncbi:MAG: hypothetical protein HYZ15_15445 [Sphingobacteriales bacterium]|nr:hypothetical protein [Sphingobacteriales bacterium]